MVFTWKITKRNNKHRPQTASPILVSYISPCHKAHKALTFCCFPFIFNRPLPCCFSSTSCDTLSFLIIWQIQFHLQRLISSFIQFTPVFSWICWWEMVWGHLTLRILFMHFYWKASSFFASVFVGVQASQPYIKTDITIVLNKSYSTFVVLPISLCPIFFASYRKPSSFMQPVLYLLGCSAFFVQLCA